jgi:hypothetical protein
MRKFYAGIGSRETPPEICDEMTKLAGILESSCGYTLRSGNATGADQAFASGVSDCLASAEIWLPWADFEMRFRLNKKPNHLYRVLNPTRDKAALASVIKYHPKPEELTEKGCLFMARNFRQVIGIDEPNSSFIVCWTAEGKVRGGTGQAMRIAKDFRIPIINMFHLPTAEIVINRMQFWMDL